MEKMTSVLAILLLLSVGRIFAGEEKTADWPQWRGPNRDGVVHGVTAPAKWPKALKEQWRVEVGEGVASPVVAGGNVYVFTRQHFTTRQKIEGGAEVVVCLDLQSGEEKWRSEPYPVSCKPWVDGKFPWPRSTPAVAGGRVFTLGITQMVSCLDAKTGKLLWRKDCQLPPGPAHNYGGNSPLVADGLCIVHVGRHADDKNGGVTAFDAVTGEVKWCCKDFHGPSSGSPILVNVAGERQVVLLTGQNLLGVSAATGKKLWELQGPFGGYTTSNTPVQYKDLLIFAGGLGPVRAIRLEKGAKGSTAKEVWNTKSLGLNYSSPVLAGDLLFGLSTRKQGCFFCLDARSGKILWESDGREGAYASILHAGSALLFLTNGGRLLVVKPSATAYEAIAEYRVSDSDTHAHPVFLGNRILIKDGTTIRSFRIAQDVCKP
jgi:outer membrane protein assembly factor BamB